MNIAPRHFFALAILWICFWLFIAIIAIGFVAASGPRLSKTTGIAFLCNLGLVVWAAAVVVASVIAIVRTISKCISIGKSSGQVGGKSED